MSFATTIIRWFRENGRDLPWRETRDPYAIWLSEVILQQTRIDQGRPYWERFMRRWPTVGELAAASEDEVLREWQGLGYYSRARNLHEAARQVAAAGHFPDNYRDIRRLKGVGDYTAAAIASFAFAQPVAVVDGNVYRVLSRHFGISTPINSTEGKKEFAALAQALMEELSEYSEYSDYSDYSDHSDYSDSSSYNQGLMDFGALQCTPANPACHACPLADSCIALHENRVGELPVKRKTLKVRERRMSYIYIRYNGETALHRRAAGDIWAGLYEPLAYSPENLSLRSERMQCLKRNVRHVLTHRVIYADFYLWEPDKRPPLPDGYFWIRETDIDRYGVPRLVEMLLEEVSLKG